MIQIQNLEITPDILNFISELDEFKGAWRFLGRLEPDRLRALRREATIKSIGASTRLAGSKVSDRDIDLLLSQLETYSFHSPDEEAVAGYAYVCDEIFENVATLSFTENTIKQLHEGLLKFSQKDQFHRGFYKYLPNHVEAFDIHGKSLGVTFETTSPFDTPFQMENLVTWVQQTLAQTALHPLLVTGVFVAWFLAIHPFQEGNGRLSRLLTTLLLLRAGYAYIPYSSLEHIIETHKYDYTLALSETQKTLREDNPNFTPWLIFFLRCLREHKRELEQEIIEEHALNLYMPQTSSLIVQLLRDHSRLSLKDFEKLTDINRHTLKKHLQSLTQSQKIQRHGQGPATWYTLI